VPARAPNVHLFADGAAFPATAAGPARRTFAIEGPFGLAIDLATLTVRVEGVGPVGAMRVVEIAVGGRLVFIAVPRMAMPLADFLAGGRAVDTVAGFRLHAGHALTIVVENEATETPTLVWTASGRGVDPS
jgi:hypothetical protein